MGRKNRSQKRKDPGDAENFKVNPFAGLHLDVPAEPLPEADEHDSEDEPQADRADGKPDLTPEDRELLDAFADGDSLEFHGHRPAVRLDLEKRARGKQVTCVRGLEEADALEQMEMAQELKKRLGIGARFQEGILELQGDQRRRARDWFQTQGYDVTVTG